MPLERLDHSTPLCTPKTIVGHATIIPGPFHKPLQDAAVVVEQNRIVWVGSTAEAQKRYPAHSFLDATGNVIIPGLFNTHTHVAMGFFRGLGHGQSDMIENFLFPAERNLTPELLEPLSYSYILDGLRAGVTSFVDHYYFSHGIGRAFDKMGVRAWLGETVADIGGAFPGVDSWRRAQDLMSAKDLSSRIRFVVAPHATDTVSPALLKEIASWANANNVPLHMHLAQTAGERARVEQRDGRSPVATAAACGALGPNSLVVHLTNVSDEDVALLAQSKSTIGWCPASTVIYDRLAPVQKFIANGIPLAIGTDCAASNDSADVLGELRTAGLFARHAGVPHYALSCDHLLAMATTQPAAVLGMQKELGTLEAGRLADFVILNIRLSALPIENPLANVIYSMGARDVTHVMIDGSWALWNRKLATADENELQQKYLQAVHEITRRVRMA